MSNVIAIMGLPGSGKTYLGNKLSLALGLDIIHTDVLKAIPWADQADGAMALLDGFTGIVEGVVVQRLFRRGLVPVLTLVMPPPPVIPKNYAGIAAGLSRGIRECTGPLAHVSDWRIPHVS